MYRRQFVRGALVLGGLVTAEAMYPNLLEGAAKRKKLLVVGGTTFLGQAITEAALVAGYDVTLFNRGLTHTEWFPRLEKLRGLRDVDPQHSKRWEANCTWHRRRYVSVGRRQGRRLFYCEMYGRASLRRIQCCGGGARSFRNFLAACKQVTLSDAELVWIPQGFLHDHGLEPRKNFPFWSPNPKNLPFAGVDYAKARRAGLYLRPVEAMISESLEWYAECFPGGDYQWTILPRAKEKEVLEAWAKHTT